VIIRSIRVISVLYMVRETGKVLKIENRKTKIEVLCETLCWDSS